MLCIARFYYYLYMANLQTEAHISKSRQFLKDWCLSTWWAKVEPHCYIAYIFQRPRLISITQINADV